MAQLNFRRVSTTVTHKWVLSDFSKYYDTFNSGPNPTSGTFYPYASEAESLFLRLSITDSAYVHLSVHRLPTCKASTEVKCILSILDKKGHQNNKAHSEFGQKDICEFENLILKEDLFNNLLLPNDTLTLFAEITIVLNVEDIIQNVFCVSNFEEMQILKPLHLINSHSESFTHISENKIYPVFSFDLDQLLNDSSIYSETFAFDDSPHEDMHFCLSRADTALKLSLFVSKNCNIRYGVFLDSGESTQHILRNEKYFKKGVNLLYSYDIAIFKQELLNNLKFSFELTNIGSPITEHFVERNVADLSVCEEVIELLELDEASNEGLPMADVKWQFKDGIDLFAHFNVLKDRFKGDFSRLIFNKNINKLQISHTPSEVGRDLLSIAYTRQISSINRELYPELLYTAEKLGLYKEAFGQIAHLIDEDVAFHLLILATVRSAPSLIQKATRRLGNQIEAYPLLTSETNTVFLFSGKLSLTAHSDVILSAKSHFLNNLYNYNPENKTDSGVYILKLLGISHEEFDTFVQQLYFRYYQKNLPVIDQEKESQNLTRFLLLSNASQNLSPTNQIDNKSTLITLVFEDGSLDFDKIAIASKSTWFFNKIVEMNQKEQNWLEFPEMRKLSFVKSLKYLTISETFLEKNARNKFTLIESLIIANVFGNAKLKFECECDMCLELRIDSAIKLLLLGDNHSEQLKQYTIEYICRHIAEIVATNEFVELIQNHPDLVCEILTKLKYDLFQLKNRVSAWLCAKVINDPTIRRLVMGFGDDYKLTTMGVYFINEHVTEIISSDEFQNVVNERSDINSEIYSKFNLSFADLKTRLAWKGDNELILTKIKRVRAYKSNSDGCVC